MEKSNLIGVIGGSGFYKLDGLKVIDQKVVETPYGMPSSPYIIGTYEGKTIAFLARHGLNHQYIPSDVNYQANIYGFKLLGVEEIYSFSAVGSLQELYKPGDFVIIDQFFDRTKKRLDTFFGGGVVAHVGFGQPVCPVMRQRILTASKGLDVAVHDGGAYVCMEGPAFSTLAESLFYQRQGFAVIGMTNLTEAKLAREAEICYASIAMVTDYDCWHESEEAVSVEMVVRVLKANTAHAHGLLSRLLEMSVGGRVECECRDALKNAIMSDISKVSPSAVNRLKAIIQRYLPHDQHGD